MNVRTLSLRRLCAECDIGSERARRRGPDQRAGSASETSVPPPGARHDSEPATRARGAFPHDEHAQSTCAGSRRNAGRVESVTVVADGQKQLPHIEIDVEFNRVGRAVLHGVENAALGASTGEVASIVY